MLKGFDRHVTFHLTTQWSTRFEHKHTPKLKLTAIQAKNTQYFLCAIHSLPQQLEDTY